MVPNRTLPIVGKPTRGMPRREIVAGARPRSILKRLASSWAARRPGPDLGDAAYLIRLDHDLDLIEHQTCDCL